MLFNLITLFLAVLGPRCCAEFSLVVESRSYSLVVVCGLLFFNLNLFNWRLMTLQYCIDVEPLVVEHGF